MAEFRADWQTAVKSYQTAYAEVQQVAVGSVLPLQRWMELLAVAEQVHVKVSHHTADAEGWQVAVGTVRLLQQCMEAVAMAERVPAKATSLADADGKHCAHSAASQTAPG